MTSHVNIYYTFTTWKLFLCLYDNLTIKLLLSFFVNSTDRNYKFKGRSLNEKANNIFIYIYAFNNYKFKSTTTQTVTVTSTVPVSQTPTQIQSTAPITVTKTTTITVTAPASQTPTPSSKPLTLSQFLQNNFSVCQTSLGPTRFTFTIDENDSILFPYDYWIQVEYDSEFFYDLKYSINISTEINHKVCEELKNFQEELARAVIELMPDKEFYGGYYDSWYRYPELQLELITRHYYIWVNYTPASGLAYYDETKVSEFQ